MIPLLGGITAALAWGSSTVVASRSTRLLGSQQALAYVMLCGLVATCGLAVVLGLPSHAGRISVEWAVLAGAASALGLSMLYRALRLGKVGVVAPIASTEGALAAVFSIAFLGERLTAGVAACLVVIACGLVVVTARGGRGEVHLAPSVFALAAACAFGVGLVASSQAGHGLGAVWTILVIRVIGVLAVALPLALAGNLPLPGAAWWMVAFSGIAELTGFAAYIYGSRHGAAVPAVLASQFAAVAAVGAYLVFRERLLPRQLVGAGVIIAGVLALTVLRA